MSRPAGEPAAIAGGSRSLAGAAAALRDVRGRLRGATSFVVVAGAWKGPASEAFLVDGSGAQTGLDRAAEGLDQAAAALSELAARLHHAQATWDRAHRLAASVGVDLSLPRAGWATPVLQECVEPAWGRAVARRCGRPGGDAGGRAGDPDGRGRRAGGGRRPPGRRGPPRPGGHPRPGLALGPRRGRRHGGVPRGGAAGHAPAGNGAREGADGHGADRHGGTLQRMAGRALEAGAEAATATHHLVAAAEARLEAAGRLAMTADDPAVRSAAARVAQGAARPMMEGRMVGMVGILPLVAPVMDFTAAVSHGEPLPRALAGAVGGAVGADLGGRIGMAACGGQAAVTQGAGLIVCPALAAAGGALGAHAGKTAALDLYDRIAGPPEAPPSAPDPAHAEAPASGPSPDPTRSARGRRSRLESQPLPGAAAGVAAGPGLWAGRGGVGVAAGSAAALLTGSGG